MEFGILRVDLLGILRGDLLSFPSDPKQALIDSFARCQRLIEHAEKTQNLQSSLSGTTCTIYYQPLCYKERQNRKCYVSSLLQGAAKQEVLRKLSARRSGRTGSAT